MIGNVAHNVIAPFGLSILCLGIFLCQHIDLWMEYIPGGSTYSLLVKLLLFLFYFLISTNPKI